MFDLAIFMAVKSVYSYGIDIWTFHFLSARPQEMLAIMKSIYDMMGRYTYPSVRDEAPSEHVDKFFQVLNSHNEKKTHSFVYSATKLLFASAKYKTKLLQCVCPLSTENG